MAGQTQRLQLPTEPPLSEVKTILERTAAQLAAHGVTGFFIAFNFGIRTMRFHASALVQDTALPPRDTLHAAAIECCQMNDLLMVTDEGTQLAQAMHFTAPTITVQVTEQNKIVCQLSDLEQMRDAADSNNQHREGKD